MMMSRRILVAAIAFACMLQSAAAQMPEKTSLTLGVGGKPLLYYLPLTLAERLGYFKEQGLNVEIADFGGGAKSLQALIGGSVDVVTGAYEHTIRMQEKGQDVRAVIELGRYPSIVLAVRKDKAASFKSVADLKGMNIGVTAPGVIDAHPRAVPDGKGRPEGRQRIFHRHWQRCLGRCSGPERTDRCDLASRSGHHQVE